MEWIVEGREIRLVKGNIALLEADAIVNAANEDLILGAGVAGAVRTLGGPSIQEECNRLAPVRVGEAVATHAGNLRARFVIHAVGPIMGEGGEEEKLARATRNSLTIALSKRLHSVAFPAISTGVFGFPIGECGRIMIAEALKFLKEYAFPQEIIFCLYDDEAFGVFCRALAKATAPEKKSSSLKKKKG
jgi:O-acetyl-ADP-ribose deacetylase (regulator of RNase III)